MHINTAQATNKQKGRLLRVFPNDYVVLDLETTGLSALQDSIIEIAMLKVKNNVIVDKFSCLINPGFPINSLIQDITGITNDMLCGQPEIVEVIYQVFEFLGSNIILGHNTAFDIGFLHNAFQKYLILPLDNDYLDTLSIARKLHPQLPNHKLSTIASALNVAAPTHRALNDCVATFECYCIFKKYINENGVDYESLFAKSRYW